MTTTATRPDGLPYEISWRGREYLTPSNARLHAWAESGISKNPQDEEVEAESPDSWFQLLGLLPALGDSDVE